MLQLLASTPEAKVLSEQLIPVWTALKGDLTAVLLLVTYLPNEEETWGSTARPPVHGLPPCVDFRVRFSSESIAFKE